MNERSSNAPETERIYNEIGADTNHKRTGGSPMWMGAVGAMSAEERRERLAELGFYVPPTRTMTAAPEVQPQPAAQPAPKSANQIAWEKWQAASAEREAHWENIRQNRVLMPARNVTRSHRHGDGMPESR